MERAFGRQSSDFEPLAQARAAARREVAFALLEPIRANATSKRNPARTMLKRLSLLRSGVCSKVVEFRHAAPANGIGEPPAPMREEEDHRNRAARRPDDKAAKEKGQRMIGRRQAQPDSVQPGGERPGQARHGRGP
jgi:hypothetical protein